MSALSLNKSGVERFMNGLFEGALWQKKVIVVVMMGLSLYWIIKCINLMPQLITYTAAEQQLALVDELWLNISKRYITEFDKRPFTRLPDLIITGRKKCGTKTLLAFLLQHPHINGNREEYFWHENMGSFRDDMKAFMGHFSYKNLTLDPEQAFVAKMGMPSIIRIVENKDQLADFIVNSTYVKQWYETVTVIECLCDPVRRLYSDFLHVRAEHKSNKPNSFLLGPHSDVYPFQNMTFDSMIDQYLPRIDQLSPDDKVRGLFKTGLYGQAIATGNEHFGRRFIVVDGDKFKVEPWASLNNIERSLSNTNTGNFFTRERFVKREDGFYCLKHDTGHTYCMPKSKGRSKQAGRGMSDETREKLKAFYHEDSVQLKLNLSWT